MDVYLKKAEQSGLVDVIKEWMKSEKYISISVIQRDFSVGFNTANAIFKHLVEEGLVEPNPTYNRGHKVINYCPLHPLKIYLLDINKEIVDCLKAEFSSYENVHVVHDDFKHFMDTHNYVECVVSPANSFGFMDGGYDKAIIDYFGKELEEDVQRYIKKHYYGEQLIGTSFIIDIPNTNKQLIHTPTMIYPSAIKDPTIIYHCMRSTLMVAIVNSISSIVIPSFGGATGKVKPRLIAKYMRLGYEQIMCNIN